MYIGKVFVGVDEELLVHTDAESIDICDDFGQPLISLSIRETERLMEVLSAAKYNAMQKRRA